MDPNDGTPSAASDSGLSRERNAPRGPSLPPTPALLRLVFGPRDPMADPLTPTRSPFLPSDAFELDLSDPAQREFGDYELLELIGRGGTGSVYRARQRSLDREVAIKLLAAGPWATSEFIAHFQQEARHAAVLQHPNIVTVFELGERDELLYYAMQLVDGESLAQRIERAGPLPARAAARLLRTLAEAVHYAHSLGILHLDLKPGNVLLDADGTPRIADFGLARRLDADGWLDNETISGTPCYMAPEQARLGQNILGAATDVWGLGAIGYEVVTGHPPFHGGTPQETLRLLANAQVRAPRRYAPALPRDLEAIVLHCLQRDPPARYPSARALADDLGRFLDGHAVSVRPLNRMQRIARWARREPRLAATGSLALLVLLAGLTAVTWQWQRADEHAAQLRERLWQKRLDDAAIALRERRPLGALPALADNLVEQEAAAAWEAAKLTRIRIGSVLYESPVLIDVIPVGAQLAQVLLDPAGDWVIGQTHTGELLCYGVADGALRWRVQPHVWSGELRLTPDRRHLIADRLPYKQTGLEPSGLFADEMFALADGSPRLPPPGALPGLEGLAFSPDGSHALAAYGPVEARGPPSLRLLRTRDWQPVGRVAERGPGRWLLAPEGRAVARVDVMDTFGPHDTPGRQIDLLDPRTFALRGHYTHRAEGTLRVWHYSPDGRLLALGFTDGHTVLLDVESGRAAALQQQSTAATELLKFSEDGQWLASLHRDGMVLVWDTGSLSLLAEPIRTPSGEYSALDLHRGTRSLWVVSGQHARLWRLPDQPGPAEPIVDRPDHPHQIQPGANAVAPTQALLAAAGSDGELRLWRYRMRPPLPAAIATPLPGPGGWPFDGRHALHVDAHALTLIDARSGRPAGPTIPHPEPIRFAQSLPQDGLVLSNAGRRIYLHDGRNGHARHPPILLPATPNEILLAPDGNRLVATYNEHDGNRNLLALVSYDTRTGTAVARTTLPGPSHRLRFTSLGHGLLAWRHDELRLLDAATLQPHLPLRRFEPDTPTRLQPALDAPAGDADTGLPVADAPASAPLRAVYADDASGTLWAVSGQGRDYGYRLHVIDLRSGAERKTWRLPWWSGSLTGPVGERQVALLFHHLDRVRLYRDSDDFRTLDASGISLRAGMRLADENRRLVVGLSRGVQLFDGLTGDWLTPPLHVGEGSDRIAGMATDPAGARLLLHSEQGRSWLLQVEADPREAGELQALAALLVPAEGGPNHLSLTPALPPQRRIALRDSDPGPPPPPASPPAPIAQPAMRPASDPRELDLRPHCNFALTQPLASHFGELRIGDFLPPGRHRLLGIDFDIGCGVLARQGVEAAADQPPLRVRIAEPAAGQTRIAAVQLLMAATTHIPQPRPTPYAAIEFDYRDGSRAQVELHYRRDLLAWWLAGPDAGTLRQAFAGTGIQFESPQGLIVRAPSLQAVRVLNPHPERTVVALNLRPATDPRSAPLLLAATIEPVETDER